MRDRCQDKGFTERKEREKGVTSVVYTLCTCERGIELEKLWEEYPAWFGAPYDFFFLGGRDN